MIAELIYQLEDENYVFSTCKSRSFWNGDWNLKCNIFATPVCGRRIIGGRLDRDFLSVLGHDGQVDLVDRVRSKKT